MTDEPGQRVAAPSGWWRGTGRSDRRIPVRAARDGAIRVLTGLGVPAADAATTARHLVEANLRGYPAHGLERVLQISAMLDAGSLNPTPRRSIERPATAIALVDGDSGLGPPAADVAADVAREIAGTHGVAVVGIRNAGHLGALAPWAERCAGRDRFALVVSSSEPGVVVPGGGSPLFGTNPIAYAWPHGSGWVSADFSTAAISRSELLKRAANDEPLPPGVAADGRGQPTRNPADALLGGLLPIGAGRKGVLLSMLAAVLAGPVVGGPPSRQVTGTRDPGSRPNRADFVLVVDLGHAAGRSNFETAERAFVADLSAGFAGTGLHVPGSRSFARREVAMRVGIDVSAEVAALLVDQPKQPER